MTIQGHLLVLLVLLVFPVFPVVGYIIYVEGYDYTESSTCHLVRLVSLGTLQKPLSLFT